MDLLLAALLATARQALAVLGPLALAAALLAGLERLLSARLQSRLGWRGVLLTGWLGVPVHELSHAAACLLFGHRVERLRLFDPDPVTGRLGSVQHAWDRRSLYQQAGRFVIGVAPLLGGALVLAGLTALLGPAGLRPPALEADASLAGALQAAAGQVHALGRALAGPEGLGRGLTWAWLYLGLCVGAHMAPSPTDLRGCLPGLFLLLGLALLANLAALALGRDPAAGQALAVAAVTPLVACLIAALVLAAACLLLVTLVTAFLPARRAA